MYFKILFFKNFITVILKMIKFKFEFKYIINEKYIWKMLPNELYRRKGRINFNKECKC